MADPLAEVLQLRPDSAGRAVASRRGARASSVRNPRADDRGCIGGAGGGGDGLARRSKVARLASKQSFYTILHATVDFQMRYRFISVLAMVLELLLKGKRYLINNRRMFHLGIDDLAEKPYIPQKKLLL